ncbi:MAG: Ig-like domain-containing protein, partial [Ilumatobacteraceae bacterium]
RRNLVVDCSAGFACIVGATLGDAKAAGALLPTAKLQDVGRAFTDHTVAGNPLISLSQIMPALPTTLDVNDVIVGSLDQSDFPWEDVDLTTAGLQDFARTGSTLDWNLRLNIDSSRAGSGPFATTVTVTLPPGFRTFVPTAARPAPAALNSFAPAAGTIAGPAATDGPDGQILVWTVADVAVDTDYVLSFRTTPGLTLGQSRATAKIQIASGAATTSGVVGVVDTNDASGIVGSALPVQSNVLYLGYVDRADDLDLYGFNSTPLAQVGVRLSHLAGDGDLVVYGPSTDRPGTSPSPVATRTATPATPPLVAEDFDISGAGYSPEPDTDAGVPLIDGLTVVGRSAARNTDLEAVDAISPDLLQVSSYNSSTSNLPYVLRVREVDPPRTPTCPAYARSGGTAGTLPDLTALRPDLSTIILVDAERLGDTFGPAAATDVLTRLTSFASRSDVNGVVVPVEGNAAVASAYSSWNANPCATDRANKVVNEITRLVVGIRNGALPGVAAHPALQNVVIVGGDDIIPMARLDDTTRLGNETGYADTFDVNGSYFGALSTSHFLSDDPYGDLDPIQWSTRRLYVPELALGRLVESPTQIIAQLDAFTSASGRLDAGRAYAAGYDFMTDGASSVRQALATSLAAANGAPPVVTGPTNDSSWTGGELLADLQGPPAPIIDAIFGHFDHTALETPTGDLVTASTLAASLPVGARLVFSMGCHSGLAVSDAVVGGGPIADDVPAALTGRGAVYLAATGFGYGDQISVGLQERLMTLFAGELDGSVSLGDAVRNAKQRYFASQGLYGAYDEKALSSTILYGLPMFAVGTERTVRPTPPNATTTPIPGSSGLSSISYSEDFTFTGRSGDAGRWYEADAGTGTQLPQITAGRPVQPRAETDVTAVVPTDALLPAHGAVVSGLITGAVVPGFDAAFSRPTLDNAAGEPEPVNSVAAFPTRLAGVTTASDEQGPVGPDGITQRQHLVLIPGQFSSTATDVPGRGTQVLFDQMSGDVYYSPSTDWTAPKVGQVVLSRSGGDTTAIVSVDASDDSGIHRVIALYQAGGDWRSVDLAPAPGTFAGVLAVPASVVNEQIRVVVQVVDGAGNVSWASNKGPGFSPTPPPPPAPVVTVTPVVPASGWFGTAPQITITGNPSVTFDVSIDGGPKVTYFGPFTPVGLADGSHVVEAIGSDGSSAFVTVRVDTTPPEIGVALAPAANSAGWHNATVTATFACTDAASGITSCSAPTSTGTSEGTDLPITGTATDLVGLTTTLSRTIKVDRTAPTVPVLTLDPANPTVDQATTLTAMTSDALSGLVGGEWWIGADPGQGNATPLNISSASLSALIPAIVAAGHYTVSARAIDAAGNWSATGTTTLTVTSPTNSRPVAVSQVVVTPEDSAVSIVLEGSDADALDVLSFSVTSTPAHGTLTGTAPDLVYTPETDFHGDDSFTFTVGDGTDTSDPATVSITVVAVNDVPTITTPVSMATTEGTTLPIIATVGDVDGDIVTVTWNVTPGPGVDAGAVCVIADLAITDITCTDDGTFTLTATADDAHGGTASAQVELTVANADPKVVITGEPAGPVPQGTPVEITATITDPGTNDTHTCSIDWGDSAITPGTVDTGTCTATHTYTTPAVNTVIVTVTDDDNATDTTTTTITITQPNRPPVAHPAMLSAVSGVATPLTLSGSDPDGDTLAFVILSAPAHGTLTA